MAGGHAHTLHSHGHVHVDDSPVHAVAPQVKIATAVLWVFSVVATPRTAVWAFGLHFLVVASVATAAGLRLPTVLRRLAVEVPFVAFAVFLPLVGRGERIHVLGLSLSVAGLWAAWNIIVKGSLGVMAAVVLAETTSIRDLLLGLERLRMPTVVVQICGFMVRYGEVLAGEMHRMRIARLSRGHDPRWIWQARAVATSAGALFIRSYERGERVYLAMQSRGYEGHVPDLEGAPARWWPAMIVPILGAAVTAGAWLA